MFAAVSRVVCSQLLVWQEVQRKKYWSIVWLFVVHNPVGLIFRLLHRWLTRARHSPDWLATWVTSSNYSILHVCGIERFFTFCGRGRGRASGHQCGNLMFIPCNSKCQELSIQEKWCWENGFGKNNLCILFFREICVSGKWLWKSVSESLGMSVKMLMSQWEGYISSLIWESLLRLLSMTLC